jgi:hypothetical protein
MPSAFSEEQVTLLYGALRRVLDDCPASKIRTIAGDAGWDLGQIPDGLDPKTGYTRRPAITSAIDGHWGIFTHEQRCNRLRHLAQALCDFLKPRGLESEVHNALLKHEFGFANGDFVPVDAKGRIPQADRP